jgi:hypothetical protein
LLLACRGEEDIDAAVFADTQWEPAAVYRHLDWLEQQAQAARIPVYRVTTGNLRADALAGKPAAWMPLRVHTADGRSTMLRRQCTRHYKIVPVRRQVRALMQAAGVRQVEQSIGISLDEVGRMRDSGVRYIRNVYPLIERRWTRQSCLHWLAEHGYPTPPKSSCIGCPYRDDTAWRRMRDTQPAEWADAVAFDYAVRNRRMADPVYLHRSLRPLDQVDLSTQTEHGRDYALDKPTNLAYYLGR